IRYMIITLPCPQHSRRFSGGYLTKVLGICDVPALVKVISSEARPPDTVVSNRDPGKYCCRPGDGTACLFSRAYQLTIRFGRLRSSVGRRAAGRVTSTQGRKRQTQRGFCWLWTNF